MIALTHQEALLPGHLLLKYMREQLEVCLDMIKDQVRRDHETGATQVNLHDEAYGRRLLDRWPDVGQKFEYLLNTGNMVSRSGLDLSQATGFTVVAEKLNFYRYVCCHRGCRRGCCRRRPRGRQSASEDAPLAAGDDTFFCLGYQF